MCKQHGPKFRLITGSWSCSLSPLCLLPSRSPENPSMPEMCNMASSLPADRWELKSAFWPAYPFLRERIIVFFISGVTFSYCLLCEDYAHSSTARNNSQLLTEWLVNKPLLWSISLVKQWYTVQCSFLSLSSKPLLVLDVSCTAVWKILWCFTQDVVRCMCSLVDNTQFCSWMNSTTVHRQCLWLAHWLNRQRL